MASTDGEPTWVRVGWYCEVQHEHGPRRKISLERPCPDAVPTHATVRRPADAKLPQ